MSDSAAIQRAIDSWQASLVDVGGRNRLLFYRPLKVGTIDFRPNDAADQWVVEELLAGHPVRLRDAFPDDEQVVKRGRTIRKKAQEHEEERGIRTLYLGWQMATWTDQAGRNPAAPILIRAVELKPVGRLESDFEVRHVDDWELNPSLLQHLQSEFDVSIDHDELLELLEDEPNVAVSKLQEHAADVPGFACTDQIVLGNFSYAKLPMVQDLEVAHEAVAAHPIVAAIAGDSDAQQALRESAMSNGTVPESDTELDTDLPPQDEYLILDADGSQSRVINAVVRGRSLVVVGPPGTGKSQTIANLIATLSAKGKSTLFVAEKRAAIEAVTKRLEATDLQDLVLDLHEGVRSRRQIAEQLGKALQTAKRAVEPDLESVHRRLERSRGRLSLAAHSLHESREPWQVSAYDLLSELRHSSPSNELPIRLPVSVSALRIMSATQRESCEQEVEEYMQLGGGALDTDPNAVWHEIWHSGTVNGQGQVAHIREAVDAAGDELIRFEQHVQRIGADGCAQRLRDLDRLLDALVPADKGSFARAWARMFNRAYRRALNDALHYLPEADWLPTDLPEQLRQAKRSLESWSAPSIAGEGGESSIDASDWAAPYVQLLKALNRLTALTQRRQRLSDLDWVDLQGAIDAYQADIRTLINLPRLRDLYRKLDERGMLSLPQYASREDWSAAEARAWLVRAWAGAVLEEMPIQEPERGYPSAAALESAAKEFRQADKEHIQHAPWRVRRAWGAAVIASRNQFPEQAELIVHQSLRKRAHMSTRKLLHEAPNVLTALKPCWAMSPLVVSQILPLEPLFDVVIFDEASQILPADAVPSLLRGQQAVIVGDSHQLPPTTFFTTMSDDDDEEDGNRTMPTQGLDSVLDVASTYMPGHSRTLSWHYRSLDERLISFSNHHIYDGSLTTFPGLLGGECLAHVEVPFSMEAVASRGSNSAEVRRVVELILEHARERPQESLGIITFGIQHAQRIEETLRQERADHPELDAFFLEGSAEPFFVKNLERVQGDERDAIILSVGYGRTQNGRMRYNFGPLNQEGGYRRLNVAVTRAKRRMTIISAFSAHDMDPERLTSRGPKMLHDYLRYATSGGQDMGSASRDIEPLNPFEIGIKDRLEAAGIPLQPQYGHSGYWIDFAAMHPEEPGRPVLAIEADGARYHSSINARERDRLRQEHLERLGWRFHRIWSTEWFRNPEQETERVLDAWRHAVADAGNTPRELPRPEPEAPSTPELAAEPAPTQPSRRGECPHVIVGLPIIEYTNAQLDDIVRWAKSDGLLHADDELIQISAAAMGYRRKGNRIIGKLQAAIDRVRDEPPPT